VTPAAAPADSVAVWRFAAARRDVLESVLSQTRVSRSPSGASAAAYLDAWSEAFGRWLSHWFSSQSSLLGRVGIQVVAVLVVAAALVVAALAIVRAVRGRGRARAVVAESAGVSAGPPVQAFDAAAWRRELLERLSRGDVTAALEALWWWLARSLAGDSADPSWTTRELLVRVKRADLLDLAGDLDVLMYAPGRPASADVTACLRRFEQAVE
jgi:hypothetical protein